MSELQTGRMQAPTGDTRDQWYGVYMLMRREVARYVNVWGQTLVPPVVTAALFLFVFGNALGGRIGAFDGVPYLTFLAPGLILQGAITNAYANNGTSMFDSRRAGYIEDVLTSPIKDWQIVLAYTVSGTSRGVAVGLLTLVVALPVGAGWTIQWPLMLMLLIIASATFALLGLLAGMHASRWDHVMVPQTFLLTPLTFLGGVFYPVSQLPADLETLSRFNPILYLVDVQRFSMLGAHELPLAPSIIGILVGLVALYAFVLHRFGSTTKLRG